MKRSMFSVGFVPSLTIIDVWQWPAARVVISMLVKTTAHNGELEESSNKCALSHAPHSDLTNTGGRNSVLH